MTISEAAQLVIQAGALSRGGDVFVLDMGQPVRILDLAFSMIKLHGLTPYITNHPDLMSSKKVTSKSESLVYEKEKKLYEELLIGKDPGSTVHPRITWHPMPHFHLTF